MKKLDRIIAALPSNRDHRFNALTVIIKLARGGSLGDFIKLTRRIPSAIPALEALQAQISAERGY